MKFRSYKKPSSFSKLLNYKRKKRPMSKRLKFKSKSNNALYTNIARGIGTNDNSTLVPLIA